MPHQVTARRSRLLLSSESWPLAEAFTISRGSKTAAEVVVVTIEAGGGRGRGECVPYPRYGETVRGVVEALEAHRRDIERGLPPSKVVDLDLPKAAANALDCALWDLAAKLSGRRVWQLLGLDQPTPLLTAYTVSLDEPDVMAATARREAQRPLLKLKLGKPGDAERLHAVRWAVPAARLIVDANEGWPAEALPHLLGLCDELGIELVEQPLPAAADEALRGLVHKVPLCADESAHGKRDLKPLRGKYDVINIKLDKTGGLTQALVLKETAVGMGFDIMVGCMLATSLAMAPAMLVAQGAKFVDLDGPLLLQKDREPSIRFEQSLMYPASDTLWG
jgi:L-alanine-DL-glutamate epimerase-like enolase superfamily enzyme